MSDKLCVVMPVYNEEDAIGPVLKKWTVALDALSVDYVIRPYNDGSKDKSLQVMQDVAKDLPCVDVRDKINGGHGNTILTGYRDAVSDGYDWVFQIDSDDEICSGNLLQDGGMEFVSGEITTSFTDENGDTVEY